MRRLNGWLHAGLGMAVGVCLVVGCIPAPNRAKLPGAVGAEGIVRTASPPGMGNAVNISSRVPGVPNVMSPPLQAPSVISNNGGNILKGSVRAPASIISHNGGNIISNNGGGIVSNNGGGIISHNGGNLQIAQLPLAFTTVRVKDAAGQPVKDDQGLELVAKTDANGNYSFPVEVKGRNLVIEADVKGQSGKLRSLLPKEGVKSGGSLDVDMTSTLTLAYILDQYVKGDLNTFERLPKDIEAKARVVTEEAIVEKQIALPTTLDDGAIVAKVDEVRKSEPKVDQVFEEIRRLLIVAGLVNEGDGLPAVNVNSGTVGGVTTDSQGNTIIFSQSEHTLWKISPDGLLHTIVPKGAWGYPEQVPEGMTPGFTSGLVFDSAGNIVVADTYHNRVVRVDKNNKVTVIAGTGVAGSSGDGGAAKFATLSRPSGVAVDESGCLYISDTESHRIRKVTQDGLITTFAGNGTSGYSGDGNAANLAQLNRPQGLAVTDGGELCIADYANNRLRIVTRNGVIETMAKNSSEIHGPIAICLDGGKDVLCLGHWSTSIFRVSMNAVVPVHSYIDRIAPSTVDLNFPRAIAKQGAKALVDTGTGAVGTLDATGKYTFLMGARDMAKSDSHQFVGAYRMAVDRNENVYVTDMGARKVLKVDSNGTITVLVGNGTKTRASSSDIPTQFGIGMVAGIDIAKDGGLIFTTIGDFTAVWKYELNDTVKTLAGTGKPNYTAEPIGPATSVSLPNCYDLKQMSDGTIAISSPERNRLLVLTEDNTVQNLVEPSSLAAPDGLSLSTDGNLVFIEENALRISVKDSVGVAPYIENSLLPTSFNLGDSRGICISADKSVYLAGPSEVLKVSPSGRVEIVAGSRGKYLTGTTRDDGLAEVTDIALSPNGNLYILEPQRLKRINREQLDQL